MKRSLIQRQIEKNIFDKKGATLMNNLANRNTLNKYGYDKISSNVLPNVKNDEPDNMTGKVNKNNKIKKIANKITLGVMATAITVLASFGIAKILKNYLPSNPDPDPIVNVDEDTLANGLKQIRIDEQVSAPVTDYKTRDEFEADYQSKLSDLAKLSIEMNSNSNSKEKMYNYETTYFNCLNNDLIMTNSALFKDDQKILYSNKLFVKYELSEHNKTYIESISHESPELIEALNYIVRNLELSETTESATRIDCARQLDDVANVVGNMASKKMSFENNYGTLKVNVDNKTASFFYISQNFVVYYIDNIGVTFDKDANGNIINLKVDESTINKAVSEATKSSNGLYIGHYSYNLNTQNLGVQK